MEIPSAIGIFRATVGGGTWAAIVLGLVTHDKRWFAASALLGAMWFAADSLVARIFDPLMQFLLGWFQGDEDLPVELRPTVDDTIRLLEHHIENHAHRHVQIQAALRLADIYRAVYRDQDKAALVLEKVRMRFPDAAELQSEVRNLETG